MDGDALKHMDEALKYLRSILDKNRGHPERTRAVEAEFSRLAALRDALTPLPAIRVERSDFLAPDDWVRVDDRNVLGRFAWSRLMRTVHAPWPEDSLVPDIDFPRDAAP